LPNGESDLPSRTGPRHGLGFTVSGSVRSGGIGQIGRNVNADNPGGVWTLQQYVWNYAQTNGRETNNDSSAYQELNSDVPKSISGNKFAWYDHPDIGAVSSHYRKVNFAVKAVNGNKQCEVQFHSLMTFDGSWHVGWGRGNY